MILAEEIERQYGKEAALLLLCCRVFLKTSSIEELQLFVKNNSINWDNLYHLSSIHRIRPLIYETLLPIDGINLQFKNGLKQFFLKHSLKAFHCQQKALKMIALMQKHNIAIQLYKGTHLSQSLYNHLSIREFGDIDFIVDKNDIPQLVSVLKEAGYKIEGDALFTTSSEHYLAHQKDIICYETTPDGTFLFEFHYKPVGSYLAMDISFKDLLPPNWHIGKDFFHCDYLPVITVNHGLVDLYPTLRCAIDIALLLQKCGSIPLNILNKKLGGYYLLNSFIVKQLFNIDGVSGIDNKAILKVGKKIIKHLLNKKEAGRVSTITILKASFALRDGSGEKLKLINAIIKYAITPNYNDSPQTQSKQNWISKIYRSIRLLQHAKRHI